MLLSSNEVLYYASHHYSLSASDVQKQILLQELKAARNVIGWDFYLFLNNNMVDYSTEPDWAAGTYNSGDLVWRLGLVYVCTANGTTTDPNGGAGWSLAPKFNQYCLNALWNQGLAYFLANVIMAASCNSIAYKVAPGGIVQINAADANQAATDRAQAVADKFRTDADEWWKLAVAWAIEEVKDPQFCTLSQLDDFLPVKKYNTDCENRNREGLQRARNTYLFMGNNYNHPNNATW
jgi:hypothetical protein